MLQLFARREAGHERCALHLWRVVRVKGHQDHARSHQNGALLGQEAPVQPDRGRHGACVLEQERAAHGALDAHLCEGSNI
jgi:hypothetical protein